MTLPVSAAELAAYLDTVGEIHLHLGANGWRLTHIETEKCATSDCFVRRLKNVAPAPGEREEP